MQKTANTGKTGCNTNNNRLQLNGERLQLNGERLQPNGERLQPNVNNIAEPYNGQSWKKRMSEQEIQQAICQIAEDWLTLDEIASRLGKNSTYLRNKVFPKLLANGTLEMMFPGVPNHPKQQYKAKG